MRPECADKFQELRDHDAGQDVVQAEHGIVLKGVDKKVDKICEAITGNGNPSKGLAARMERIESAKKQTWKIIGLIFAVIAAATALAQLV